MARTKLSPAEKEKRKLERRAAKKAARKVKKQSVEVIEKATKKGKAPKSAFKLIELPMSDEAGRKRLAELRESGIAIRQVAYATGYFVYEVPSNITGYAAHGTSPAPKDNTPDEKPLKTIADLVAKVEVDKNDGAKLNKRYVKLLVRNSELKRNLKREAVETLIKQFKIK